MLCDVLESQRLLFLSVCVREIESSPNFRVSSVGNRKSLSRSCKPLVQNSGYETSLTITVL
jgi:hypothetical protein